MKKSILPISWLQQFLGRLRFPYLFGLSAILLTVNLFVPDVIPFADEILMAAVTAALAAWRRRGDQGGES